MSGARELPHKRQMETLDMSMANTSHFSDHHTAAHARLKRRSRRIEAKSRVDDRRRTRSRGKHFENRQESPMLTFISFQGAEIQDTEGNTIGKITSGCPSPTLKKNIAMGYIKDGMHKSGTEVQVVVRGKARNAVVAKMPFVPSKYFKER